MFKKTTQFLNEDNDLLGAEQLLADNFSTFDVSFDQMVTAVPHGLGSTRTKTKTTTQQDEAGDISRSCVVSNEDIEELKSVAVKKKNTCSSTRVHECFFYLRWSCHHLDINIETMAPEELDKVLSKFYADVKKKNGNDCEP